MSRKASDTRSGSAMAVQRRAYGVPVALRRSSTSVITGPCRVSRTVRVMSSPPATPMVSVRTVNGSEPSSVRYFAGSAGSTFSSTRSWTSGLTLVTPQAMRPL